MWSVYTDEQQDERDLTQQLRPRASRRSRGRLPLLTDDRNRMNPDDRNRMNAVDDTALIGSSFNRNEVEVKPHARRSRGKLITGSDDVSRMNSGSHWGDTTTNRSSFNQSEVEVEPAGRRLTWVGGREWGD